MKSIKEVKDFKGKKVLLRVDWNVPFEDGKVVDDSRIVASIETIEYILNNNGKIVLMAHFGREGDSMDPVFEYAKIRFPILNSNVEFLPNLRIDSREEENDKDFAKELADRGDVYVNEAFSVSHREHASVVGVPKLIKERYAGINFINEVNNLSKAFKPPHPFLFILGGAKFETKLPLVEKFLSIADHVFIGGALAVKGSQMEVSKNPKIFLPLCDYAALDADLPTVNMILEKAKSSKFILWNGPLGKYEDDYTEGTKALAQGLAELHDSGVEAIVGGGDTLAAIKELGIEDKFTFVSTSGGAMLDFLANSTLPGIEALE